MATEGSDSSSKNAAPAARQQQHLRKPQQLFMALENLERVVIPPPQGGTGHGGNGGNIGLGDCDGVGGEW